MSCVFVSKMRILLQNPGKAATPEHHASSPRLGWGKLKVRKENTRKKIPAGADVAVSVRSGISVLCAFLAKILPAFNENP